MSEGSRAGFCAVVASALWEWGSTPLLLAIGSEVEPFRELIVWAWGYTSRRFTGVPLKRVVGGSGSASAGTKHGFGFGSGGCFGLALACLFGRQAFLGRASGFAKDNNLDR